jgi:radical SAM superfamily enzyme YgiQ (UPF0313 family)
VRAFDQFVSQLSVEALAKQLESYAPSVVGIGVLTPVARVCEEIAQAVKLRLPSCTVVAGNIHADFFSKEVLAWGSVDVVVHGEGEATFAELLEVLADSGPGDHLAEIAGISVRSSAGEVLSGPSRPLIKDLDTLPHPAWQHFPVHSYGLLPMADLAKPTLVMSASRGCPYRCEFCSLLHRGSVFRARDPRAVADEYSLLHSRFGARQIGFVDPVFPLAKKTCLEFCEEILRRGLQERVEWISETRVDCVDRHTLRMMRRSGCRRLLFGIESGVDLLLDGAGKSFSTEQVQRAVALCREEDIQTVGLFMLGLPGETREMTERTIRFSCELGLDFAKFAITIPYPGSALYDSLKDEGRLNRTDWENWTTFQPVPELLPFVPREVSNSELVALQRAATRRFYLRPSMVVHQLFRIRSLAPSQVLNGIRSIIQ